MRRFSLFLLALAITACASSATVPIPDAGALVPEAGAAATVDRCGNLDAWAAKWQDVLNLEDWTIAFVCREIPEERNAWALSFVDPIGKTIGAVVDPDSPDAEQSVLHELTHGWLTFVRDADSELVEEQAVRALSAAALCRPQKGGGQ